MLRCGTYESWGFERARPRRVAHLAEDDVDRVRVVDIEDEDAFMRRELAIAA